MANRDLFVRRAVLYTLGMQKTLAIQFPFNPASIKDSKSVTYADGKGDAGPLRPTFEKGGGRSLSFSVDLHQTLLTRDLQRAYGLPFGVYAQGSALRIDSVREAIDQFRVFLYPKADLWSDGPTPTRAVGTALSKAAGGTGKWRASPPSCRFTYGSRAVDGVVTELSIEESGFDHRLEPTSAKLGLTIAVYEFTLVPTSKGKSLPIAASYAADLRARRKAVEKDTW